MSKITALEEFKNMWKWLYSHPAHDQKYYAKYVAKADPVWQNNCPISDEYQGDCKECLALWNEGKGTLCEDKDSPLNQWRNTNLGDPDFRTWYAGKIVNIAFKVQW